MKKREFLALGGAVPLILAGCGGDGAGSAPVRLVNASVGYPSGLGFLVNTTQATTSDVAYGGASTFSTVEAGTVTTAITVSSGGTVSTVSSTTRTLNKDQAYDLIAFGAKDELRSVLLAERTTAPDSGYAAINVLNTSSDGGLVDVFLSKTLDLSLATQIAGSVGSSTGASQSAFTQVQPGSYYITVTGARTLGDIRFQSPVTVAFVDQQIVTIILTPGVSGTLANAIVLTQGTGGTAPQSFVNSTARVRAVVSINDESAAVAVAGVLAETTAPSPTNYAVVPSGAAPVVTVNGNTVPITSPGTLEAGGDYTLMVYLGADGNPIATALQDDNTAPTTSTNAKMRLVNLVYNPNTSNHSLGLAMYVDSILVATNIGYASASGYVEVAVPVQGSTIEIKSGAALVSTHSTQLAAGKTYTDIVVGSGSTGNFTGIQDTFFSSTTN
jgi:hypothetical protein